MPPSVSVRQHWIWVTGPDHYATLDGTDSPDLAPGNSGYWTCSRHTEKGDLVLLYRTAPRSDIAYLFEAASDAFVNEWRGKFAGSWSCEYESRVQFASPLSLSTMRADNTFSDGFGPLKAQFRQRSYRLDPSWWTSLISMLLADNPTAEGVVSRLQNSALSKGLVLESEIEERLARRVALADPGRGLRLYQGPGAGGSVVSGRQFVCPGVGRIDLLCQDNDGLVVVEIKRDRVGAATIGQVLMYMGWIQQNLGNKREKVRGIVVGRGFDPQFQHARVAATNVVFVDLDKIMTKLDLGPERSRTVHPSPR